MILKTPGKAKDPSKFTPGISVVDLRNGGIHCVPPPQANEANETVAPELVNGEVCMLDNLLISIVLAFASRITRWIVQRRRMPHG